MTEVSKRLNKVEICGVDTATLPMLSAKEMHQLLLKVKAGDEGAREEFIRSNLRLVLSIVQRFSNRSEMMDDLFQVGCIGLIKAIDNFDLRHEVRFSTYAVPMIIGEIRRHLRDNNAIRVSRSLRDTAYKALQARNRLAEEKGQEPALSDVAAALGLTEEAVSFALEAIQEPVSLFEPVYRDDGDAVYVIDQLRDERVSDSAWLDHIALSEGMRHLTERKENHGAALPQGRDPDGGGAGDRHQPGAGLPAGKGRAQAAAKIRVTPRRSAGACHNVVSFAAQWFTFSALFRRAGMI